MGYRLRRPDYTFLAMVVAVAFVQVHYWDVAWRFGGTRLVELRFRDLTLAIFEAMAPRNWGLDLRDYRYLDAASDLLVIATFSVPALAVLLIGRTRRPGLTIAALRIGAALYLSWILLLSPQALTFHD